MELHEEYFDRRKLGCPVVKFLDKSSLILRAKDPSSAENAWLHLSIESRPEGNHPNYYQFTVSASPVIYASPDFSHFSCHHAKQLVDQRWEWDNYENNILAWVDQHRETYEAVKSDEAIFVSWEMFCVNYDSWMANFLSHRMLDLVYETLRGKREDRLTAMREIETHIKDNFERVFVTWKSIKQTVENRHYADWLADIVNRNGAAA